MARPTRQKAKRTLVLFSGGLDSTVLLAWAKRRGLVATLTFASPQRPLGERRAEAAILRRYGVRERHRVAFPGWIRGDPNRAYAPGRNLYFYATATLVARGLGIQDVAGAHLATDGLIFPDARRDFFNRVEVLANWGRKRGERSVRILTPFLDMGKGEVVALGRRFGAPLEASWSCYRARVRPCGRCEACRERAKALAEAPASAPRV